VNECELYYYCTGSTPAIALIESIMEHIAHEMKMDPLDVRMKNLIQDGDAMFFFGGQKFEGKNLIPDMLEDMKNTADYEDRKKFVQNYNKVKLGDMNYYHPRLADNINAVILLCIRKIDGKNVVWGSYLCDIQHIMWILNSQLIFPFIMWMEQCQYLIVELRWARE